MLQINLLGDQDVSADGTSLIQPLGRRAVELLAYLTVHPRRPQQRHRVAETLWPESSSAQALTNLRREIHRLRAVLGASESGFEIDSQTLRWNPSGSHQCDVVSFLDRADEAQSALSAGDEAGYRRAAGAAVDRFGGEFMNGATAEWILAERERLHNQCIQLIDRLTLADVDDDPGAAVAWASRRVELEPIEEAGYQALMRAQVDAGDRAAALRTFHRCVSMLDRELGVRPGPVTIAKYEQISATEPTPTAQQAGGRSRRPMLIGRTAETAELQARWRSTLLGAAGLHLVTGEAGVGKSRLIDDFVARHVPKQVTIAWAVCVGGRSQSALSPVAQWLRSPSFRGRVARLQPKWRAEVERLVPPMNARALSLPPSAMVDGWRRSQFREGLSRALVDPAHATLLVVDDLHWCDDETVVWIRGFLESAQSSPVLVLATARSEELEARSDLVSLLGTLRQSGTGSETQLTPLVAGDTGVLAADVLGVELSQQEVEAWQRQTGGYPLFIVEVARMRRLDNSASQSEQPQRVHDVLGHRLDQLSDQARQIAGLAACVRREFSVDLLFEASDMNRDQVVDAVDELWRRRIFRSLDSQRYDFSHDLFREAAYERVGGAPRALHHRRVAQVTELMNATNLDGVAAELAEQYGKADQPDKAIRYHMSAANQSSEVFANTNAIRHYSRGLELLRRLPASRNRDELELRMRHAMSAPLNAEFGYASQRLRAELERSAELAERLGDDRQLLMSLAGLFAVRFVQGDVADSFDLAQRALDLVPHSPDAAGQAHFAVGGASTSLGRHAQAMPHFEAAHHLSMDQPPSVVGTRPEVHGRAWCAHALWLLGEPQEADRWSRWAVARAEETGHQYSLAVAVSYASITQQLLGERDAAREMAGRAREVCSRYGFAYYREWGVIVEGWCTGGHAGVDQINQGLQALRGQGAIVRRPYYLSLLAQAQLSMGHIEPAGITLDAAIAAARHHSDVWWLPELLRLKALTCADDLAMALRTEALQVAQQHGAKALCERIGQDLAG